MLIKNLFVKLHITTYWLSYYFIPAIEFKIDFPLNPQKIWTKKYGLTVSELAVHISQTSQSHSLFLHNCDVLMDRILSIEKRVQNFETEPKELPPGFLSTQDTLAGTSL